MLAGVRCAAVQLYNRLTRVRQEATWVVGGQVLAFTGGVVGVKVLTNVMTPEAFGELALGLSLAGALNMFLFGPAGQVTLRFYSVCQESGSLPVYYQILRKFHLHISLLLLALCVPTAIATQSLYGNKWAWLVVVAVLFSVLSGTQGSLQSLFSAMRERRLVAIFQVADVWGRFILALLLVLWMGSAGRWALVGYTLGALIVLITQMLTLMRNQRFTVTGVGGEKDSEGRLQKDFFAYGLPFVSFAGLAAISQYADRWLLQSFWSEKEVGIYMALYQIASAPVAFVMGVISQLAIPVIFERSGGSNASHRLQSSRRLFFFISTIVAVTLFLGVLVAYLWGGWLVTHLTNRTYALHSSVLWLMVLALAFFNLAQWMVTFGLSRNRSTIYFWPKLGQAVSLLIAGYLLVVKYTILGMALALVISSVVYFIWVSRVNSKLGKHIAAPDARLD